MFFPKWNPKQASHWERIRARGKARFVFLIGGLGVGTAMLLGTLSGPILLQHQAPMVSSLLVSVSVSLFGGVLWGILMWNMMEGAYRRFISEVELSELTR